MLFPLIGILSAFLFDKAFYAGELPYYFLNTASFINYDHKEEMIYELKEYLKKDNRKKTMVMFGNSRTTPFSNPYIEKKHPEWILFNFSVPGGTSDYFAYFMERFQKENIHPDFIFFTVTPQGFNIKSKIQMDEVMIYGLPFSFIISHIDRFSLDEISNYAAKKLFWNYRNKPELKRILQRAKEDSFEKEKLKEFILTNQALLKKNRGSANLGAYNPKADPELLKQNALDIWNGFLAPFAYSETQDYFTKESLRIASEMKIPAALLWARVSPPLRELKNTQEIVPGPDGKLSVRDAWVPHMISISKKYGIAFLDMNYGEDFSCDVFQDASHMAGICFDDFTDYLIRKTDSAVKKELL